jgi:uncharacterized protein YbjT (DUF2867 family)
MIEIVKLLIAGANGKVGTILSGKLWGNPSFSPIGLIRDNRQQTKFTALGVPSVLGDLEEGVSAFLPGLDAVVFTAGSGGNTGPEKTTDVDQNSAVRLIGDCEKAGVRRFIMISAIGADPSSDSSRLKHYLRAKGVADARLRSSKLDYTILAPGTLIDERGTGRVQVSENLGFHGYLPREDLVDCIIECLKNFNSIGKTFQVVSGGKKVKDAFISLIGGGLPPIA